MIWWCLQDLYTNFSKLFHHFWKKEDISNHLSQQAFFFYAKQLTMMCIYWPSMKKVFFPFSKVIFEILCQLEDIGCHEQEFYQFCHKVKMF